MKKYSVGEIHPIKLTGLAIGGESVGRLEDLVVFVPFGCPGDEIEVLLGEVKKSYARGEINRIIKESPHRQKPPCPIFYKCGGCQLQQMTYGAQLINKRKMVEEVLHHLGGVRDVRIEDVLESPNPWYYRNKMQVVAASKPFLHSTESSPYFGLYARQTHKPIKMELCAIQHPLSNKALKVVRKAVEKLRWTTYNEKTGEGLLRYLITRVSESADQILITLVTTTDKVPEISKFVQMVTHKIPETKGIIINKNSKKTNVILGPTFKTAWGDDFLIEEIKGIKYKISANSFFQVNPRQTGRMFEILEDMLDISDKDVILDAYCGVGAISLWLAPRVHRVIGIEEIPQAKKDARASAEMNGIGNLEFHVGKVEKVMPEIYHRGDRVDKIVLDPPRKGCEESVLEKIVQMRINRVVYVSCNPSTLARDIKYLKKHDYRVRRVVPLDMFPQTYHVECIALLEHKSSSFIHRDDSEKEETGPAVEALLEQEEEKKKSPGNPVGSKKKASPKNEGAKKSKKGKKTETKAKKGKKTKTGSKKTETPAKGKKGKTTAKKTKKKG